MIKTELSRAEKVLVRGDLNALTSQERLTYYEEICASLGLNKLTRPFDYITLSGKLVLYARRDCAEQLRKNHDVSLAITARDYHDDLYIVTARATMPSG